VTVMWIAEDLPAHRVFVNEQPPPDGGGPARIIIEHRSRKSAGRAMGHYLRKLAKIHQVNGEFGMFHAAADMFAASGSTAAHTGLTLRIRGRVYRVRKEEKEI
jgi:hypothetical protein